MKTHAYGFLEVLAVGAVRGRSHELSITFSLSLILSDER